MRLALAAIPESYHRGPSLLQIYSSQEELRKGSLSKGMRGYIALEQRQ